MSCGECLSLDVCHLQMRHWRRWLEQRLRFWSSTSTATFMNWGSLDISCMLKLLRHKSTNEKYPDEIPDFCACPKAKTKTNRAGDQARVRTLLPSNRPAPAPSFRLPPPWIRWTSPSTSRIWSESTSCRWRREEKAGRARARDEEREGGREGGREREKDEERNEERERMTVSRVQRFAFAEDHLLSLCCRFHLRQQDIRHPNLASQI